MGDLLFTQNISDGEFVSLSEITEREDKNERESIRKILENHIPLYIHVKPENNLGLFPEEIKPNFVPLNIDEIIDLYANGESKITVRLDRLLLLYGDFEDISEEAFHPKPDNAPLICKRKIKFHQTFIRACDEKRFSVPMPVQLKIVSKVWKDVFSKGLTPTKPPKTRKEYTLDYLKTNHSYIDIPQRGRLAIMATGDTTGEKVKEPVTTSQQYNDINHELYSPELEAALDAWVNGIPDIDNISDTDKSTAIIEYLKGNWPQLSDEAVKRIKFVITT